MSSEISDGTRDTSQRIEYLLHYIPLLIHGTDSRGNCHEYLVIDMTIGSIDDDKVNESNASSMIVARDQIIPLGLIFSGVLRS